MKDQGLGGSIVFIASKNALAASPGASAYCTAKAAEVHLARCLALEGAPLGIRVNTVNPDAVLRGSKIWQGEWRAQRAASNKVDEDGARRGLPPALAAEALGLSRGHRRGGLFLRLRPVGQEHRQHSQRRRRQRSELHAVASFSPLCGEKVAGEARRMRGGARLRRQAPPLTPTLSPQAGRGGLKGGILMSYRIPDALISEENAEARGGAGRGLRSARPPPRPRRHRHRRDDRQGRGLRRRRPDLGRRHRRHALRPLSRSGRAARHLRQARGLRDDPPAHPRDADLLAPLSRGTRSATTRELAERAKALGVGFDAVNSNTFQDQPGQTLSYKFGSLSHSDKATRDQAVAHNLECIEIGEKLGSKALTVWIADGSNFPGQSNLNRVFDWYLESLSAIYRRSAGGLAGVPRTQALRAGLLFDGHFRLGHEPDGGRELWARRPTAWSTSATMRRTSISSRSSRG